jgi:hypothetical protein
MSINSENKYRQHYENTYENFFNQASKKYYLDNPDYKKNKFDDLKVSLYDVENLNRSIFSSIESEYKILIKKFSDIFKKEIHSGTGRPGRGWFKALNGKKLSQCKKLDDLIEPILNLLVPIIDREITGFYSVPWYVESRMTLVMNEHVPEDNGTAWQWHYDGIPKGCYKLFIYLTDVNSETAPFTYMVDKNNIPITYKANDWKYISRNDEEYRRINPSRNIKTRISANEISTLLDNGNKPVEAHGKAGSFIIFNQNNLHKATFGKKQIRNMIQFHMRPTLAKPKSYWHGTNGREHHTRFLHDYWSSEEKLNGNLNNDH